MEENSPNIVATVEQNEEDVGAPEPVPEKSILKAKKTRSAKQIAAFSKCQRARRDKLLLKNENNLKIKKLKNTRKKDNLL